MSKPTPTMPTTTGIRAAPPPTYSYPPSSYPAATGAPATSAPWQYATTGTPATAATWQSPNPTTGYARVPTTIPMAAPPAPVPEESPAVKVSNLVTKFKEQGHALIAARRPFGEMFHASSFSKPASLSDATDRIRRNLTYFRANYMIAVLGILACSLFWHPGTLITLVILIAAWYFLYFAKSGPLVLFDHTVDDGTVLGVLSGFTILAMLFTNVGSNVIGSLLVGVALVLTHAALRSTDDLFLTEQEAQGDGLVAGIVAAASATGPVLPVYVRKT